MPEDPNAPTPNQTAPSVAPPTIQPNLISADDFGRVELRVGTIITAEPVAKSDKMLKLTVDLGESSPRTILAGIGKSFQPSMLQGSQYVFVANLPPRKMFGIESNGMILATGDDITRLTLLRAEIQVPNGSRFH